MTNQTKSEALEASILHWQENVKAETPEDVHIGVSSCALCSMFFKLFCEGCPVDAAVNKGFCFGTPYETANDAYLDWKCNTSPSNSLAWLAARDDFHKAAQAEVDFLISLRETER